MEVPLPPHPEPTGELATVTQWVAAEELSQVFSPNPSEMEISWDDKRAQLRFHNDPWMSDEIDNRDLIDFCLLVEPAKEDWQLQQIWMPWDGQWHRGQCATPESRIGLRWRAEPQDLNSSFANAGRFD